ncbi:MAG: hypothetical protein WA840_16045 [Caulobacteraceae bacterium]
MNDATIVDHDHRVRDGVQDRLEMGFPLRQMADRRPGGAARAAEALAADRRSDPKQKEDGGAQPFPRAAKTGGPVERHAQRRPEHGANQPGPKAAHQRTQHHRRDGEEEG